ncbi:palindromic element RPE5 domain-containing protein [Rickettsia felis]|nr:palindromic element RPE5 domain-containing protein [Rickettsia felis]MDE8611546.1 palindromic element RPE5 domain-containing protein [Rickettsia felis]
MIIAFIFGVFISKYRVTNLHGETLHKPIITKISGNIESIKPTIIGGQIVLNNIKIEKINRNLQKVKISIPRKYLYSSEMQSDYMKINLEKSNRSVSRGAERTEVREHPRTYKDDVANFGGSSSIKEIRVNDRITLLAKLYKPQNAILPGGYDFGFYAYIGANGYAMSQPQIIERNETNFDSFIYRVRIFIYNNLIEKLGKDKGNFAAAILLGETKGLNRQIMQDMRQSGIITRALRFRFAFIFSRDDYFPYYKIFIKSLKLFGI